MISTEKPGTPEELVHLGVKGMHWGVRKKEETSGRKPAKQKPLTKEQHKRILDHSKRVVDKAESPEHRLTPEQKKKIAYTLAGAIVVAGILGGAYYLHKKSGVSIPSVAPAKPETNYQAYFSTLKKSISHSLADIPEASLSRPDFTLPKGQTFHRLSSGPETKFMSHTYTSTSIEDFHRYVTAIGGGHFKTKITFNSNKPIKVASTKTVLDTLREILPTMSDGQTITESQAKGLWSSRMGGRFDDDFSVGVFKALKKKGFSAIVDENDAGIFSENPIVIFNHSGLGKKSSHLLLKSEIAEIHDLVTPVVKNLK